MENNVEKEEFFLDFDNLDDARKQLLTVPDEAIHGFTFRYSYGSRRLDDDPVDLPSTGEYGTYGSDFRRIQEECRRKALNSAHVASSTEDYVGRLTGYGFNYYSSIPDIQDFMDLIWKDPRNRMYNYMPKYVGRSQQEGELFLIFTVQPDGFIEIDFAEPSNLEGGSDGSGIVSHPYKQTMPLFYMFNMKTDGIITTQKKEMIPSIYAAYYPELKPLIEQSTYYNIAETQNSIATAENVGANNVKKYKKLNGFRRFIISWDKSMITKRNLSHLRTVITWINHYETLKRLEIEHKKSCGAYAWVIEVEDAKAFKQWLAMTDEQRSLTGITAKKEPGSTLMLPPGMKIRAENPNLPKISGEDADILQHIAGGLNTTSNILTGSYGGTTYGAIKEGGKTQTDRTKDKIVEFERFLKYDFWRSVFWLSSRVSNFKYEYKVKTPVGFTKEGKVKTQNKIKPAEECIELTFPVTAMESLESKARGLLGSKSGSLDNMLGIPKSKLALELGFANYEEQRLQKAYEDERYPDLIGAIDPEQLQKQSSEKSSDNNDSDDTDK